MWWHWLPAVTSLLLMLVQSSLAGKVKIDSRSPLYLRLPDCRDPNSFTRIKKSTQARGIVCASFKNEEGFLSEFVTYYQMHGIDHVRLFDLESVDDSLAELKPWTESGFVSIENELLQNMKSYRKEKVQLRQLAEMQCKKWAQKQGYEYHFGVDINEYIMPVEEGVTIMDAIHIHVQSYSQSVVDMPRLYFQASPHTLEPIDLLTIEAYHYRLSKEDSTVHHSINASNKVALRLNHASYDDTHRNYIVHCCNMFGCELRKKKCKEMSSVLPFLFGIQQPEDTTRDMSSPLLVFHYARSLEKFELQYSVNKAASSNPAVNIEEYMQQSMGTFQGVKDDSRGAMRYGCQMREMLKKLTNEDIYLRPGTVWYRNIIYGKALSDGRKGKRNGAPVAENKKIPSPDDVHIYHGFYSTRVPQ